MSHGDERRWFANGQLQLNGRWRGGKLEEAVTYTPTGQESGRVISGNGVLRMYRPDGTLARKTKWEKGRENIPPKPKPSP